MFLETTSTLMNYHETQHLFWIGKANRAILTPVTM